jgi:hypothetical protein
MIFAHLEEWGTYQDLTPNSTLVGLWHYFPNNIMFHACWHTHRTSNNKKNLWGEVKHKIVGKDEVPKRRKKVPFRRTSPLNGWIVV